MAVAAAAMVIQGVAVSLDGLDAFTFAVAVVGGAGYAGEGLNLAQAVVASVGCAMRTRLLRIVQYLAQRFRPNPPHKFPPGHSDETSNKAIREHAAPVRV